MIIQSIDYRHLITATRKNDMVHNVTQYISMDGSESNNMPLKQ